MMLFLHCYLSRPNLGSTECAPVPRSCFSPFYTARLLPNVANSHSSGGPQLPWNLSGPFQKRREQLSKELLMQTQSLCDRFCGCCNINWPDLQRCTVDATRIGSKTACQLKKTNALKHTTHICICNCTPV